MRNYQGTNNNNELLIKNPIPKLKFGSGAYFVIGLWLLVILLSGCANTVTPIVSYGAQMKVTVTLRGTMDVNANRYFLILSPDLSYSVPKPAPYELPEAPELIEPGTTPLSGSAEAYQNNFYSTWAGYAIIEPAGYLLVKGPLSAEATPSRETLAYIEGTSQTLTFTFRLDQIFAVAPDRVYLDFVTVPWVDGQLKVPADHLISFDNNISKVAGSVKDFSDAEDQALPAALDLKNVRVEIQ